jgi:hypothetical protein
MVLNRESWLDLRGMCEFSVLQLAHGRLVMDSEKCCGH